MRERLDGPANRRQVWAPEPTIGTGRVLLPDGTRLERSALVNLGELQNALRRPGRLVLQHHWASWAPAVADDLPILLELHLAWAQHVDVIGVGWEAMSGGASLRDAALEVDAFHRSYGLTWRTLVYEGDRLALRTALRIRSEILPQTMLCGPDGAVLYLQEGALDEDAGRELEAVISHHTGVVDRPRLPPT